MEMCFFSAKALRKTDDRVLKLPIVTKLPLRSFRCAANTFSFGTRHNYLINLKTMNCQEKKVPDTFYFPLFRQDHRMRLAVSSQYSAVRKRYSSYAGLTSSIHPQSPQRFTEKSYFRQDDISYQHSAISNQEKTGF